MSRPQLFFALSRTPPGLRDMAPPAFSALLWLGTVPPFPVVMLGLLTAFAGYTAVYALNDLVDYQNDREKARHGGWVAQDADLDALMVRHPLAQGLLSYREGLIWAVVWAATAVIGAYLLNPVCVFIFIGGCLLEPVYCLMWRVSPFRTVVSGAVKTTGPVAGVFAVDPSPEPAYLTVLFLFLFLWEIGGQNIPNDWTDIQEDRRFSAKTVPVCFGLKKSAIWIMIALILALFLGGCLFPLSNAVFHWPYMVAAGLIGCQLLLLPAYKLRQSLKKEDAMTLFNRASYYPLALLVLVLINALF
ncbi:MAG: UbiA family prenyltransferase [Deltaproteobacteria bacterium]|nr:UbiA family prenyltransferase [Deltaproteobacteria bacterium]